MHYYRGAKRCRWVSYLNSDETQAMSGGLKLLQKTKTQSKIIHISYRDAYGIDFIDVQK